MTTRIQAENSARPNFPSHTLSLSELSTTKNITYLAATATDYSHNHGPAPVHATKPNVPTTDVAQSSPKYPINEPYPCNSGQLSLSVPTTVAYSTTNYPDNGSSTSYSHSIEVPVQTLICSVPTSVTHSKPNYLENAYHHPSTSHTHANHTPLNTPTPYLNNRLQKHSPNVPTTVAYSTPNYSDSTYNIEELSDRSSESSISSEENNHGIGLLSGIAIGSSEYLIYYITLLNH